MEVTMQTLKDEAIEAIQKLPESATMDDIMYRLYVIDKVKRSQKAVKNGKTITVEELKREIQSW
jgi:DNA-binding MltR family transcriptional regulator